MKRLLVALAAACAVSAHAAEEPRKNVVQDPHYGDTLFHFFQDHYFTAITTLMASQHFERVQHHADEAEVLRGGMLLSYGLHREAGEIFARLVEQGSTKPAVRDRAWFYLAKVRYQRGLLAEAQAAIDKVGNALPRTLEEERKLLQADILLARGEHAAAAQVLGAMVGDSTPGRYARFNLGVALVRSGDAAGGRQWLDKLGTTPAIDEEQRSLRDKANVALGFAALKDERAADARIALERVRLKSPQANKALLGFGWAAAALKQPKSALVPWMELAQRDAADSAVLEARIAVPYAYAELGAYGQALQRYEEAIAAFEREGRALDESIGAIRTGKLVEGLIKQNPGDEMGWFWRMDQLPEMPHAGHLSQVLAQHDFQEAFKNYRDLRFLSANLQHWAETIDVYGDMLATRKQAFAERLPKVLEQSRDTGREALEQRYQALAEEMKQAEAAGDGFAFADPEEQLLLGRLKRVQEALAQAGDDPDTVAARERARRIAGALVWRLAERYPARVWEARKALSASETGLAQARDREAALVKAQAEEPQRFERFGQRITELDQRIKQLQPQVAALTGEQQQVVQALAVDALQRQKERLVAYTAQARFAVAQLVDRALQKDDGKAEDAAPKKTADKGLQAKGGDHAAQQ